MEHAEVRQALLGWRDDPPGVGLRREIDEHLRECAGCRRFGERLDWISSAFSGQTPVEESDFFVDQVMDRVRTPAPVRSFRPAWWWVPALAPGVALLLMVIAMAGNRPRVSVDALLGSGAEEMVRITEEGS